MQRQKAGHLRTTPLCSEAIVGAVDAEIEIPNKDAKTASQHHGQTDTCFLGLSTGRRRPGNLEQNERQKRPHGKIAIT